MNAPENDGLVGRYREVGSGTRPDGATPAHDVAFRPRTLALRGRFELPREPAEVFPLFSPLGEKLWVPGWSPELLHPPGVEWAEGQVFRTREETGEEVVWIVTRLELDACRVEYRRVVPGRYVATVDVRCRAAGARGTEVEVDYAYVGLAEAGNRDIETMSQRDYDEKMARWKRWIEDHLGSAASRPGSVT